MQTTHCTTYDTTNYTNDFRAVITGILDLTETYVIK